MRESVATYKVSEAMAGQDCALCALGREAESRLFESFFREMVLDGPIQAELAKLGMCRRHLFLMLDAQDKLGAALALRTLVRAVLDKPGGIEGWRCFVCKSLEEASRRHAEIMGDCFAAGSDGELLHAALAHLCLPHLDYLISVNAGRWPAKTASSFEKLCRKEAGESLRGMASELEWFIKKFDYRMRDEPWRGTEDIVRRVVEKIGGK